jgi:hypothetical protein
LGPHLQTPELGRIFRRIAADQSYIGTLQTTSRKCMQASDKVSVFERLAAADKRSLAS